MSSDEFDLFCTYLYMIGLTTQPTKGHLYKKGTTITQSHGKTRNLGPKVYGQKKKLQRISAMKTWYLTEPGILDPPRTNMVQDQIEKTFTISCTADLRCPPISVRIVVFVLSLQLLSMSPSFLSFCYESRKITI